MDLSQAASARAVFDNHLDQRGRLATFFRRALSAFLLVGVLLPFVALNADIPRPDLGSAWMYAMNEAVARHMVFGRDIIFTLGPYACTYTGQYHPATDHLMLIGDMLFGLALATGALLLAARRGVAYLLPLPVLIVLVGRESVLLSLPLLFLMVSVRTTLPDGHKSKLPENWQVLLSLTLMMLALSLLPLVKGTFCLMSATLGGLGWLMLLRWRVRWALLLGAVFVVGLIGFWLTAGQPLEALPGFFVALIPIVTGYSDAMSITGPSSDLIWYGANAGLMLFVSLLFVAPGPGLSRKAICLGLGLALSLFIVFKESFVRHDIHAMIAPGFVLLASFLLATNLSRLPAAIIMTSSLAMWLSMKAHYLGMKGIFVLLASFLFATNLPRLPAAIIVASSLAVWFPMRAHYPGMKGIDLIASIENSRTLGPALKGIRARLGMGPDLHKQFETARAKIRQDAPLPRLSGTADIYPFRQDILLANGLRWSPRPIVQSYSAYEPSLADINAEHLLGSSAPRHVFFDVFPIDSRLASLEDGKSWPLLLARYHLVGRSGPLLVLDRNPDVAGNSNAEMENIATIAQRLGHQFNLPEGGEPVWAEIELKPTLLGRIIAALFKPPQLHILFRYVDGHTETFRYVAAMGRSGFIVAPVIHDTVDFAALLTRGREQYFPALGRCQLP